VELDRIRKCSEHDAALLAAQWRSEIAAGVQQRVERERLGDFAKKWLCGKLNVLLPPTIDRYTQVLDDHVLPALGDMYLDAIAHDDIVAWRDREKAAGYKAATVNGFLRMVKTVLADAAVLRGAVSPAARVASLPEDDTRITDEEPNALTAEEAQAFLSAARDRWPEHYPLIFTLLLTGARMSQVCALMWQDIDETNGKIRFRRRRYQDEVYAGTKGATAAARRRVHEVALTEGHAAVLREHRSRLVAGQHRGLEAGWVFPARTGGLHANSVLDKPFKDILAHLGITKRFTPHGLRRTCTDLTRQVSSAVVTKAITGHLTDAMHQHYSTVSLDEKRAAMSRVVRLVSSGGSGGGSRSPVGEK
jgi:integrase